MKTDDLITMLASGAEAAEPHALERRFTIALGWGAFGATLLMAIMLGVRPDLSEAVRLPMFWGPVYWTGAARFEVGLRSGDGVLPALDRALPWSADGERPPLGFSLGIGVPIR